MKLFVLHADSRGDIEKISEKLKKDKFKVVQSSDNFTLLKRKRYGNTVIQLGVLFFALFFFYPLIFVNLAYFTYSYLFRSPNVLVTTETKDKDDGKLEFDNIGDVLEQANAIL